MIVEDSHGIDARRSASVLVVHLAPSARVCEAALERAGCEVLSAADLYEAEVLLASLVPDLVVVHGAVSEIVALMTLYPDKVVRFGQLGDADGVVPSYSLERLLARVQEIRPGPVHRETTAEI